MPAAPRRPAAKASAPAKKKQEIFFDQDRETKGTFRYAEAVENGQRGIMGTIWIRKDVAEKLDCVDSVKVTIEADTDEK
jgi:hypothetical protein